MMVSHSAFRRPKNNMAAMKQFLACTGFSRQFSKCFIYKCFAHGSCSTAGRGYSLLMFQRLSLFTQTSSHSKSYSVFVSSGGSASSLINNPSDITPGFSGFKVKDIKARILHTTVTDDPEFASERIVIPNEYIKDLGSFDDTIKKVKEKTGVLIQISGRDEESEDDVKQWNILIGGSQHEVKNAVSFLKSSLNPKPQKQRSTILQAEKMNEKYFEEKVIDTQMTSEREKPIWAYYRRNFKGQTPPMKTRKRCIRGRGEKQTASGNPCPICRLYLGGGYELDYKDIDLLLQFISPDTGEVFEASKTGLCRAQQENLIKAIEDAKDYGVLPYSIAGPRSLVKPSETAQIPQNVRLK